MILGAWLLGVACGAGYVMILNEILGRRRRFEQSGRFPPPPVYPDPDDGRLILDISDQDSDIQRRAW